MMYGWDYQSAGVGWAVLMLIGMLFFWTLLVIGLIALVRRPRSDSPSPPEAAGAAAIEIVRERFARGELSEEEYARRLAILKNSS